MLATLTEPFDREGWLYEIKWDGYRAIAMMNGKDVNLLSRKSISFNQKYYPVYDAIKAWGIHAVVDGEIVVMNKEGRPDFNSLQNWQGMAAGEIFYYVFDLLWLDGYDLTSLPIEQRRELLRQRLPQDGIIRFSENFTTTASGLLKAVKKMGMEGIIAKKSGSAYFPGIRSEEWVKMKSQKRQEVVIGGYLQRAGSPKPFSSLLVGVYERGKYRYAGKVGTGFSLQAQKEMLRTFKPLIRETNPFQVLPKLEMPPHFRPHPSGLTVTFLEPRLVCEVHYTEFTAEKIMRHPSFAGMRDDMPAKEVVQETAVPVEKITASSILKHKAMPPKHISSKPFLNPDDETQVKTINKKKLKFTNLDKLYWPEDKITKRDLLNYYDAVASFMLPYLKNRPMSLNRHPDGYAGKSFYQKDVTGKVPDWVETMPYRSEEEAGVDKEFMVCTDKAGLLYMANLGCIEINPWSSTVEKPEYPDWCVLDLDPDKKNDFDQVIEVALMAHDILEAANIPSLCKTSGSTGLHIYIPLGAKYTYEQSMEFARLIVTMIQREMPKITSIERQVPKRRGKIYLDFLQNRTQATLAAPYSARPKPEAPVSMPLHWDEVKKGLRITDFTNEDVLPLLEARGDIFKGVLGKGIDMEAVLERLEAAWNAK